MKAYWDSSALVESFVDLSLRLRLRKEGGVTRTHALAETFSALTSGNLALRVNADIAAQMVAELAQDLEFVDLTSAEVLEALEQTRKRGVQVDEFMIFFMPLRRRRPKQSICSLPTRMISSFYWIR